MKRDAEQSTVLLLTAVQALDLVRLSSGSSHHTPELTRVLSTLNVELRLLYAFRLLEGSLVLYLCFFTTHRAV